MNAIISAEALFKFSIRAFHASSVIFRFVVELERAFDFLPDQIAHAAEEALDALAFVLHAKKFF